MVNHLTNVKSCFSDSPFSAPSAQDDPANSGRTSHPVPADNPNHTTLTYDHHQKQLDGIIAYWCNSPTPHSLLFRPVYAPAMPRSLPLTVRNAQVLPGQNVFLILTEYNFKCVWHGSLQNNIGGILFSFIAMTWGLSKEFNGLKQP